MKIMQFYYAFEQVLFPYYFFYFPKYYLSFYILLLHLATYLCHFQVHFPLPPQSHFSPIYHPPNPSYHSPLFPIFPPNHHHYPTNNPANLPNPHIDFPDSLHLFATYVFLLNHQYLNYI